jgi:heme/copper-type cytochrome/quinol oxidase subunit 2
LENLTLLRQANQLLGQAVGLIFFTVMCLTPLVILVLGVLNYRRDRMRQAKNVLQALGALAIWAVLTFVIVMIFFMTVFEYPAYHSQADEIKSTAIFVGGSLIYFLAGGVLVFWTKRQTKRMPGMGVSC